MTSKTTTDDRLLAVSIRLGPETLDALDALSATSTLSRSALLRLALEQGLPKVADMFTASKPTRRK